MEALSCRFCARVNPADAKFCNECGTPLNLRPCRQCDAVNARGAERCYRCDAALPGDEAPAALDATPAVVALDGDAPPLAEPAPAPPVLLNSVDPVGPNGPPPPARGPVRPHAAGLAAVAMTEAPPEARSTARPGAEEGSPLDQQGPFGSAPPPPAHGDDVHWHVDESRLPPDEPAPTRAPVFEPRRPRAGLVLAVLFVALAVPGGVYVAKHPEALSGMPFGGRLAELMHARGPDTGPAAPVSAPAPATAENAAAASVPSTAPPIAATPPAAAPAPDTSAMPSEPAAQGGEQPAAASPPAPPPAAAPTPARADTTASASSPAKSRTDTRSTRPQRTQPPPRSAPPPEPARTPCTPAVAALGLC